MLERRLSLLHAISVNMSMMVGIGPFITLPLLVGTLGGPASMIGWVLGAAVALADGMVWSELAGAFPGSGGTYHFYDAAYGDSRIGRMLKFVFVWQFFFSGPLEIATGAIGTAKYLAYFYPELGETAWSWGRLSHDVVLSLRWEQVAAMGILVLVTALAYRRIAVAGRLMVVLWLGVLATVAWVIAAGLTHFSAERAFDFPGGALHFDQATAIGLGMAVSYAMYNFLGYYQVCYLGDEVDSASKTIPRSIIISVVATGIVYLTMHIAIFGVLERTDVVASEHIATDLMLHVYGPAAAGLVTVMIIWTAFASIFAALLGYSRIPYASARAGHFFRVFGQTHPTGHFPHRSLILIGALSALACLVDLETVIAALLASRILIQFVGQIATVVYLRVSGKGAVFSYRMPLYPLPAAVALAGWFFVFWTSRSAVLAYAVGSLAAGVAAFLIWDFAAGSPRATALPPADRSLASDPLSD